MCSLEFWLRTGWALKNRSISNSNRFNFHLEQKLKRSKQVIILQWNKEYNTRTKFHRRIPIWANIHEPEYSAEVCKCQNTPTSMQLNYYESFIICQVRIHAMKLSIPFNFMNSRQIHLVFTLSTDSPAALLFEHSLQIVVPSSHILEGSWYFPHSTPSKHFFRPSRASVSHVEAWTPSHGDPSLFE